MFCSAGGSGDFAAPVEMDIEAQIEFAKQRIAAKTDARKFVAYFQSYTGTYGDIDRLERIYTAAARLDEIAAISIATRPDCLGADVMAMLERLSQIKPLWVELGLQCASDRTAERINRGYPTTEYLRAVQKLRQLPLHLITHVIFGLPGETAEDMMASVRLAGEQSDGIKLQLLHILEQTPLADWYRAGKVKPLTMEEYFDLVVSALEILPEGTVMHRLTGDGNKRYLLAPLWSADKKRVMNALHCRLRQCGFEI